MSKFKVSTLILFCALGSYSCSEQKTIEQYQLDASKLIAQNNSQAAIIELKNAIKQFPRDASFRGSLGNIYAEQGLYSFAEKELSKAIELGAVSSEVYINHLRSLIGLGKSEDVVALAEEYSAAMDEAIVYMFQAIAYTRLEQPENAELAVAKAKDASEESAYGFVSAAHIVENKADIAVKIELAKKAIELDPNLVEARLVLGQLYFLNEEFEKSSEAFKHYVDMLPFDQEAKMFLSHSLIKASQFDEANVYIKQLLKNNPEQAFANQLAALVAYSKEDYEASILHAEKAIQNGLNNSINRSVLGLSAFKLKRFEQAHSNLQSAVIDLPATHPINQIFALVQLELGYDVKAGDALSSLSLDNAQNVDLLSHTSFSMIKKGMNSEALSLINKIEQAEDNAKNNVRLGVLKLSMNDLDGVINLEKALQQSPGAIDAEVALARAYLISKDYDKASAMAASWKTSHPENPVGYILSAQIQYAQNEYDAALTELDSALKIAPDNKFSLLKSAEILLNTQRASHAEPFLNKLFEKDEYNVVGLTYFLRVKNILGQADEAEERVKAAYLANQTSVEHQLLYAISRYNKQGFEEVIDILAPIAQENVVDISAYWATLGDSYINTGQADKALTLYDQWIIHKPNLKEAHIRRLIALEKLNNLDLANDYSSKLLRLNPMSYEFRGYAIYYALLQKQYQKADKLLKGSPDEFLATTLYQGLQGELLLEQEKFDEAIPKLEARYEAEKNKRHLVLYVQSLHESGKKKQAFEQVVKHYEMVSKDLFIKNLYAEYALEFDVKKAKTLYDEILNVVPNQVAIINNLAWAELQLGNLDRADELSAKALLSSPQNPLIMDTRAQVLIKQSKYTEAMSLLEQALVLAPNNANILEHHSMVKGKLK